MGRHPGPSWRRAAHAAAVGRGFESEEEDSDDDEGAGEETSEDEDTTARLPVPLKSIAYTEDIGEAVDPVEPETGTTPIELTNNEIYRIIREVVVPDSGEDLYSAVSADREFRTSGHRAYGKRHFGLGFGLVLFTQESGRLGRVLQLTKNRDPEGFAEIFGPHAEQLLAVTTARTAAERLRPVGDENLWSPSWRARFRRAGALAACQNAQNEEAIEGQFRPMLKIAGRLGLTSDRGLAMAYDRVVTCGLGGGLRWIVHAAGSLRTEAQRVRALRTLGWDNVQQFQIAIGDVPSSGVFDPQTHAAVLGALRRQGAVALPTPKELTWRLAAAAVGTALRRLSRLRDSTSLTDTTYSLDLGPIDRGIQ